MKIRRIDASTDLEVFKDIRVESARDAPESFRATEEEMESEPIDSFRKQLTGQAGKLIFIGAFEGSALVGVAALYFDKSQKLSHKATVGSVFVKRTHRGRTIGKMLMTELLRIGREEEKLHQVDLTVNVANTVAIDLYQNLGFKIFGTEKNAAIVDGKSYDEHHMQLFF